MNADDFDILGNVSLHLEDDPHPDVGRRQAFRATPVGVTARVRGALDSFGVNDISAGGICMTIPAVRYAKGDVLTLDVLIAGRRFLSELSAVVVRSVPMECACAFQGLTRHQELKLDKLVLELQKRAIALRRQERDAQERHAQECQAEETRNRAGGASAPDDAPSETSPEAKPLPTIHLPL